MCLSYLILGLGEYVVVFELIPRWATDGTGVVSANGRIAGAIYTLCVVYSFIAHLRAMLADPGYTPSIPTPDNISAEKIRFCDKCRQFKPQRSHHCRVCNRCVHRMDHHCPWINSCIGGRNQKFFMQFVFSAELVGIYTLITFVMMLVFHLNEDDRTVSLWNGCLIVASLVLDLVFLLFTAIMFEDQLEILFLNQSNIEEMSGNRGLLGWRGNLRASLGPVHQWANPFSAPRQDFKEDVARYTKGRDPAFAVVYGILTLCAGIAMLGGVWLWTLCFS